jgi:hypothetical protein
MANKEATLILKIKEMGSEAISKVSDGVAALGKAALAAGAAIAGFAALGIKSFREQEEATNKLNQAMVNSGVFTKELAGKYNDLATNLQKTTTFGDEATLSAIATLQTYSKGKAVTEDLIKVTQDFATAQRMDLASAADIVGKTIGTSSNALGRYGVKLSETASESEKTASVIKLLGDRFGGQAEAQAKGLGAIEKLKNAFSDFMEGVGEQIAPTVIAMSNIFTGLFTQMQTGGGIVQGFGAVFDWLARMILYAKTGVSNLGIIIGTGLASAIEGVKLVAQGEFRAAKDIVGQGMTDIKTNILENNKTLNAELELLTQARLESQKQKANEEIQLAEQSAFRKAEITKTAAADAQIKAIEEKLALQEVEMAMIGASDEAKLQAHISYLDKKISQETNANAKLGMLQAKAALTNQLLEEKAAADKLSLQKDTFGRIATLSQSNNQALATIGKAAAITQIAIDTPVAIGRALSAFPPPFNFAAAGLVGAAMAAQAARIAGVQLAEGGIVRATPGGIQATIGEGGRDEAVIPLDSDEARGRLGGGGNVTIVVNGGLLGDASSAREFARAVDKELLKLRQNNESQAFDTGVV